MGWVISSFITMHRLWRADDFFGFGFTRREKSWGKQKPKKASALRRLYNARRCYRLIQGLSGQGKRFVRSPFEIVRSYFSFHYFYTSLFACFCFFPPRLTRKPRSVNKLELTRVTIGFNSKAELADSQLAQGICSWAII